MRATSILFERGVPCPQKVTIAIRVVAMDDEADILRLVRIKLEKAGFQVSTALDGEEGMEKVSAERPDVMIVDVMMPKKDGYQVVAPA